MAQGSAPQSAAHVSGAGRLDVVWLAHEFVLWEMGCDTSGVVLSGGDLKKTLPVLS